MSSGRFSSLVTLGVLLACGPVSAQEPAGGEASVWTDPPARTAPQEPEKTPPAAPEAKAPEVRAPEPSRPEPARARRAPEPTKPEPTQAEQRQDRIRRAVERSTAEREAEARGVRVPRRSVVERPAARSTAARSTTERPQRFSERPAPRLRERQVLSRRSIRRPVYGYADPVPVGPVDMRYRAGPPSWDEGPPDYRARRIDQARAAGYLVMRSRSYAYPDGTVIRRLSPLGPDAFDD